MDNGSPTQVANNRYQLWLNLTTKQLELHAVNCTHALAKKWRQYQQFGTSIILNEQADLDAVKTRATNHLGADWIIQPQACSASFQGEPDNAK